MDKQSLTLPSHVATDESRNPVTSKHYGGEERAGHIGMNRDHEQWDSTPYQPDPPAIKETAQEEARLLRTAAIVTLAIAMVLGAAVAVGACWVIWRAWHL